MTPPDEAASLFRHAGFRRLWAGDAVSQLGSQLSGLALPVLAIETFRAGAFQMGVLEACTMLSFLVLGLPTGAWVDRMRKRRVLVWSDLVRAVALATIPIALLLDAGTMAQLYVVAIVVGASSVFFDVAWQSYLPILLRGEQLVDGNAKLSATESVAGIAGPAAGGFLLRALGAPLVVALDALTFLASAAFVRGIEDDEPPHDPTTRQPLRTEVMEGLRFVLGHPLLRRITACTALSNLAFSMAGALSVLYLLEDLDQTAAGVGIMFAVGSAGALVAAITIGATTRVIGEGRAIPVGAVVGSFGLLGLPIAADLPIPVLVTASIASFVGGWGAVAYNVTQVSFRQRLCPPNLLARMNASVRFLVWGTLPIGSLLGGVLGEVLGIVPTLWIAFVVVMVAVLPVLVSPLARMRGLPAAPGAAGGV